MDNSLWSIDRIENNIAVLENINSQEKKEISIDLLPKNIKEGSIISYINNQYILSLDDEKRRRQEILEKFMNLRKNN